MWKENSEDILILCDYIMADWFVMDDFFTEKEKFSFNNSRGRFLNSIVACDVGNSCPLIYY